MRLYVEGGGNSSTLKTACREGFTKFITAAGLIKRPRIVACGSRSDAYNSFCTAIANDEEAMLLVDSEASIDKEHMKGEPSEWLPWAHLAQRKGDGWEKPAKSSNMDCHLMVEIMESWFLADRNALSQFFGRGFNESKLPASVEPIESITKDAVYRALQEATKNCRTKSPYGKGEHSFKLLALITPSKVADNSPWAKRFISAVKEKMDL